MDVNLNTHKTDEDLMVAIKMGDKTALEEIFGRYKSRIFRFAFSMLRNRADAEDSTGDVFLLVYRKRHTFKSGASFSPWIYAISRNRCLNMIRKKKKIFFMSLFGTHTGGGEASVDIPDDRSTPTEEMEKKEQIQHVRSAIKRLPYEQREAITLRQYHGFTYNDISRILECSLEKVKILIYRAKEQLRRDLASYIREESL